MKKILFGILILSVVSLRGQSPVVSYDIAYVKCPRAGDTVLPQWTDVFNPYNVAKGCKLVLLHPNGTEEILSDPGPNGGITDLSISFDAKFAYYTKFPDLTQATFATFPAISLIGSDIWKVNLATKQETKLTDQVATTNTAIIQTLPYGVYNTGPTPVSGGKIAFTSNKNGFITPKGFTPVTAQLFVMNEDGSNVMAIAPMTLGSALHPFQLMDGRLIFSTKETQGLRDSRLWSLWYIWPDGRHWAPGMMDSSIGNSKSFHFQTQLSDGSIVAEDYYNANNEGFGAFVKFPPKSPPGVPGTYSAFLNQNPPLKRTDQMGNPVDSFYGFSPFGITSHTIFTNQEDQSSPIVGGIHTGKVTHPSGAPNNDLLLVWTPGPANNIQIKIPYYNGGIYLAKNGIAIQKPSDLILIKNDPNFSEMFPHAVVPYSSIYGIEQPFIIPFLPNDGTVNPDLPQGTPFGIIGTSSFYNRESFPGWFYPGTDYNGLDPFNTSANDVNTNWQVQGSDVGRIRNSDICKVRLITLEATSQGQNNVWFNHVAERMRILGEVTLRKTNANGTPLLDYTGNPDTSFWAKIPADVPITFQMIDCAGRALTIAQTWHQVRPGEVRVDCGGCHAHSSQPVDFDRTAAINTPPADFSQSKSTDVEFLRDIRPILTAKCISCHTGNNPPGNLNLNDRTLYAGTTPDYAEPLLPGDYARLAHDASGRWGYKPVVGVWRPQNSSRYVRKTQGRRSLLVWYLAGERLDGWVNSDWPTETIPGNPNTLPGGVQNANLADLNYNDTANHAAKLTAAEKELFYKWIDLGASIDLGGYFKDETRPTLAITPVLTGTSLSSALIGAVDSYSGLNNSSLVVKVDNTTVTPTLSTGNRWSIPLTAGTHVVNASIKDVAGNITSLTRTLSDGVTPPPPTCTNPPMLATAIITVHWENGIITFTDNRGCMVSK